MHSSTRLYKRFDERIKQFEEQQDFICTYLGTWYDHDIYHLDGPGGASCLAWVNETSSSLWCALDLMNVFSPKHLTDHPICPDDKQQMALLCAAAYLGRSWLDCSFPLPEFDYE